MKVTRKQIINCVLIAAVCLVAMPLAAQGGIQKVNRFMDTILTLLRGVSVAVVTIAIMVTGYKLLFKHADIGECAKILGGALVIGGAAEIARYIMN